MGMTIAEKILARASGSREVYAGDYVTARIDVAMSHEESRRVLLHFREAGVKRVWDPERIVILFDHYTPPPTVMAAEVHKSIRSFVKEQGIKYFYDIKEGICHQVMPEKGHVRPGELIVGTDSHTITYGAFGAASTGIGAIEMAVVWATGELWFKVPETVRFIISGKMPYRVMSKDIILHIAGKYGVDVAQYKSIEFTGPVIDEMSIDSRMTLTNMSVEIGAKFSFIPPDEKTVGYVKARTGKPFTPVKSDPDATYDKTYYIDVSDLEPQVACPHSVDNVKPVSQVEGIKIDQAFLGSCTNGRFEDLSIAAEILKGKKIHPDVRMIIVPASREIYMRALNNGIINIFLEAGASICFPACGPCFGSHLGLLASGEKCISSANRNFKGRMGSPDSEIYLASPATVVASAIMGEITDPRKL
ncbi:MAG: 3-isopropylmalate dehydratase large subunit [Candidatus Methanomethylicia archaeon]